MSELNFELASPSLLAIVGQVGCGKTTLLHLLMKEAKLVSGEAVVQGSVAYVEQEPFIFSASIKDNILFGKQWDEELFQKALDVACLDHDIKEF